jgi:putative endonuclease
LIINPWWLYIVECSDGSLYTGVSPDVEKRVEKHNNGNGAKYTRTRLPVRLLFSQEYENRSKASSAEYYFKQKSRSEKIRFLEEHNAWH